MSESRAKIETAFEVNAGIERVWAFLTAPERVIVCLPAATLDERIDEHAYRGAIELGVGPLGVTFRGTFRFERLEGDLREAEIFAEGSDTRGRSRIEMRMQSQLVSLERGSTRVEVSQRIELGGRMALPGGGRVLQKVAEVTFSRFSRCVQRRLAVES